MSSNSILPDEEYYRKAWEIANKPENREIVDVLGGKGQLEEERVLEEVDLSEKEFLDAAEELEQEGFLDHYDQEHGRGHQNKELSLYSVFYPVERAIDFDDKEEYVQNMLNEDKKILGQYQGVE